MAYWSPNDPRTLWVAAKKTGGMAVRVQARPAIKNRLKTKIMKKSFPWLACLLISLLLPIFASSVRADGELLCIVKPPGTTTICTGESATFVAEASEALGLEGPLTYEWFGPGDFHATTATITVSVAGTYVALVTDVNGNSFICSGDLVVNQAPTVSVANAEICLGESVVLTVVTDATDILWSTGETTKSITVSPVTKSDYTVTVTGDSGCVVVAKSTVTVKSCVTNPGVGTPGFWKTHPEAWPVNEIVIGGIVYSKSAAIALMKKSTEKDMSTVMFEQLVAAKLNILIGNDPSCISSTIIAANAWMTLHPVCSKVAAGTAAWSEGEPLKNALDSYNNGKLCAPARD
jgi:hypothetical protein